LIKLQRSVRDGFKHYWAQFGKVGALTAAAPLRNQFCREAKEKSITFTVIL